MELNMRRLFGRIREKYCIQQAKRTLEQITREYKIPGTDIYHTPDAPAVDAKDFHLVLFYDEMMKGKSEHSKIDWVVQDEVGQGITQANVQAWVHEPTKKVLAFPAFDKEAKPAWMGQTGANPAPIKGDLFKIPTSGVFILDKMFENMINYQRFEVDTVSWLRKNYFSHTHNRTHTTVENPKHRKAWIYLANPDRWQDISTYDGWKPLTIYPPRNREKGSGVYYNASRRDQLVA
jgi:hypothetical protein